MKRLVMALSFLLTLTVCFGAYALTLYDGFPEGTFESSLTDELSVRLSAKVEHCRSFADAADAFLNDPASDTLLVCSPQTLILSLQGYVSQDLREAMQPVARIACADAGLYASPAAMDMMQDAAESMEKMTQYTDDNPYVLYLGRLMDASQEDMISLSATNDMYLDQNLYMDYSEMAQALDTGSPDVVALSDAMYPAELSGKLTKVAVLPGQGEWITVFARSGVHADAAALQAACTGDEWNALLMSGGYRTDSWLTGDALQTKITDAYADYVSYMTSEGLFFYEW